MLAERHPDNVLCPLIAPTTSSVEKIQQDFSTGDYSRGSGGFPRRGVSHRLRQAGPQDLRVGCGQEVQEHVSAKPLQGWASSNFIH